MAFSYAGSAPIFSVKNSIQRGRTCWRLAIGTSHSLGLNGVSVADRNKPKYLKQSSLCRIDFDLGAKKHNSMSSWQPVAQPPARLASSVAGDLLVLKQVAGKPASLQGICIVLRPLSSTLFLKSPGRRGQNFLQRPLPWYKCKRCVFKLIQVFPPWRGKC